MRTGGVYLSPDRRPLARPARLARARARARLHDRHLARRPVPLVRAPPTRACSASPPTRSWSSSATSRSSAPPPRSPTSRTHTACSPRACPTGAASSTLDPIVRRLGELVAFIVAEINEPDPAGSADMKTGYRGDRAGAGDTAGRAPSSGVSRLSKTLRGAFRLAAGARAARSGPLRCSSSRSGSAGDACSITGRRRLDRPGARDLAARLPPRADRPGGRARGLAGGRPPGARRDGARADLARPRATSATGRLEARSRERGRRSSSTSPPTSTSTWPRSFPEEFVDTNLHGSWNVLRAAEAAGVETVVVASTDKAALAASFYGRTKRFMEQLTAFAARAAAAASGSRSASSTCSAAPAAPRSCSSTRPAAASR